MEIIHDLVSFVEGFAASPHALWILFILAFAESSFFPIPPDVLLIPLAIANPALALIYASIATVSSVLGGVFGFWIGKVGGKPVLNRFAAGNKMNVIKDYYNRYDMWAVAVAGFTPIPYKVFTIAAGVFDLGLKRFILASLLGRGGRFFLVGIFIFFFGPAIKELLDQYLEIAVLGITILLIGGFVVFHRFLNHSSVKKNAETKD